MIRDKLILMLTAAGAVAWSQFNGLSAHIVTLATLMCIDFMLGLVIPLFFKRSKKSKRGEIHSKVALRGLFKKCTILLMVWVCKLVDDAFGSEFIANAATVGFMITELVSIMEHATVIGVPVPRVLVAVVSAMQKRLGAAMDVLAGKTVDDLLAEKNDGAGKPDNEGKGESV